MQRVLHAQFCNALLVALQTIRPQQSSPSVATPLRLHPYTSKRVQRKAHMIQLQPLLFILSKEA